MSLPKRWNVLFSAPVTNSSFSMTEKSITSVDNSALVKEIQFFEYHNQWAVEH
jgi:hypothetical protein